MRTGTILLLCALFFAIQAHLGLTVYASTLTAALGYDPKVVDTGQNTEGEAYNVQGLLESIDISVLNITDYNDAEQWQSVLAQSQVLVFPEAESLEGGASVPYLNGTTVDQIRNWVRAEGGVVVIFRDNYGLANYLLGQDVFAVVSDYRRRSEERLQKKGSSAEGPWAKTPQAKATTLFRDAPEEVETMDATVTWNVTAASETFSEFACLYGTTDDCVAWMLPDGAGLWFSVGPDYYDSAPLGVQNGGWVSVLTAMMKATRGGLGGAACRMSSWLSIVYS